jgi:hypothetical protein
MGGSSRLMGGGVPSSIIFLLVHIYCSVIHGRQNTIPDQVILA